MNKSLTLISRLVSKTKSIKEISRGRDVPQYKIMENLAFFIEEETNKGQDLVATVINLLQVTPTTNPKQKFDCFLNIRSYVTFYPHFILDHIDVILKDSFFKDQKNNLSINEINNIYYHWIYAQKMLIKYEVRKGDGSNQSVMLISRLNQDLFIRF